LNNNGDEVRNIEKAASESREKEGEIETPGARAPSGQKEQLSLIGHRLKEFDV
jgi:hypothetical protein